MENLAKEAEAVSRNPATPTTPEDAQEKKKEITAMAVTLLNSGVDPKVVGQILAGSTPFMPVQLGGGGNQDAYLALFERLLDTKRDADLAKIGSEFGKQVSELVHLVKSREVPQQADPLDTAAKSIGLVTQMAQALKESGFITSPQSTGTNVEALKATHQHEERMEELRAGRAQRDATTEVIRDLPRKIGAGIAQHLRNSATQEGPKLLKFACESCGESVFAPPGATKAVCVKCGQSYDRKEE